MSCLLSLAPSTIFHMDSGNEFIFYDVMENYIFNNLSMDYCIVVFWNVKSNGVDVLADIMSKSIEYSCENIRFIMIHAFTNDFEEEEKLLDEYETVIQSMFSVEHFYIEPEDTKDILNDLEERPWLINQHSGNVSLIFEHEDYLQDLDTCFEKFRLWKRKIVGL